MAFDDNDRQLVMAFVTQSREDIGWAIEAGRPYLDGSVAESLDPAWEEVQDVFRLMLERVERGVYDQELDERGLGGSQLQFKLLVVDQARDEAVRDVQPRPRRLRRLLKAIDVPLGSILAAIGAGEALKELKEGVEVALPDEP